MEFQVPSAPKLYTKKITNFLGVDFTSISPSERRASNLINLVNNDGYLETRPGYNIIGHEFGIAASLFTDTLRFVSIRKGESGNDVSIKIVKPDVVNSKLSLTYDENKTITIYLATDSDKNNITTANDVVLLTNYYVIIEKIGDGTELVEELVETNLSGGINKQINGIWNIDKDEDNVFIVHVEDKLYELDEDFDNPIEIEIDELNNQISQGVYLNNKLIIFDGKEAIVYSKINNVWEVKPVSEIGYIPTTNIARNPDGTGGTIYEDINLVQSYRINSFLPDGATATYVLDSFFDNEEPTATILQSDGTIATLNIQSFDKDNGTVTFDMIPPTSPVTGRDSVFVRFKVTNAETNNYINKCSIITLYGYDGNTNRLFVTGNPDFPNVDWFSEANDATYFPAENYTRVGFQPIENYLKLNDGTLAIQKKISDTDYTVYYRKSATVSGKEVFPISSGVKSIGCISRHANSNLLNDPITLTEQGVYSIMGSNYGEKFAVERGYFIKNKLLEEPNLETAIGITFRDKYYLAINDNVYVADSRYKTRIDDARNSTYQYEWYFWNNIPVRIWFIYNDELYFATKEGNIVKFNDTVYDYNIPIFQLFDTTYLDLDSITEAKTVKKITIISRPYEDSELTLSYMTNEDGNDIINKSYNQGEFPNTLQEKEKIKKIMFVKFRLSSNQPKKMNFYQIGIEFIYSGRYRGE